MKLAKKLFVALMTLALVASLALCAFAVDLSVSANNAKVGETVTVTVSASGLAGAYSGDLIVSYNADVLEYTNSSADNIGAVTAVGHPEGTNTVTYSFMFSDAATVESSGLFTATFTAKAEGAADISVAVKSWDAEDGSEPAAVSTSVTVSAPVAETTTAAPKPETTTAAPKPETTTKKAEPKPETTTKKDVPTTAAPAEDESTTKAPAPVAPSKDAGKKGGSKALPQTGDTAVAIVAGVMAVAAVGFVATRKKEEI